MIKAAELLRQGRKEDLWQMCCGYVDLSMEQFMTIQERLLWEQLELLKKCELGQKMMQGAEPGSLKEFREQIPLTTYADYAPYLQEKREDVLPEKPVLWMCCVGRFGEYRQKWVPVTQRVFQEAGKLVFAAAVFASCKERGDIVLREDDKFLHALAPPPYATGMMAHMVDEVFSFALLPRLDIAEKMHFEEKIHYGFQEGLSEGLDFFGGLTSVLVRVGEKFSEEINGNNNNRIRSLLSNPGIHARLGKGWLKSKLARRPMLPKDVWSLKGIVGGGSDSSIYREKVKEMWGKYPLDIYGCTENIVIATQTWDFQGMTFNPYLSLLEFIPAKEYYKWKLSSDYRPSTLMLDEVEPDQSYVLAFTNFHGGPFVRYVLGDMIRVTSLRNEELDIDIPQIAFDKRVDGLVDIAGFARLTERTIGQAIEDSGLVYQNWAARKEAVDEKPVLHIYMELKEGNNGVSNEQVTAILHEQLGKVDNNYADLENLLDLRPLKVTLLQKGTFRQYASKQQPDSIDSASQEPLRVDPSDSVIETLLNSGASK
ncbi:GH3 auxin-responsive promoter family protein [Chloroflexota bacterium]